ncbi:MAG: FtsX-like permease family protein, partial [Demequina sp.]|uniref:FtsX-like permease family protein n=1 Tax=Demequina sp. TaxID=2050685 RepID=UPI003A890337
DARSAWQVGVGERIALDEEGNTLPPAPSDDVLLHGSRQDNFDGEVISVTAVAVADSTSVAFPAGLDVLAPGEFYASPAVMDLVATTPADEFKNRYGTLKGVIPEEALRGPDELAVLSGADWDTLASDSSTRVQEEFDTVGQRYNATTYRTILAIGSVALLVPIVLLIGVVAQLGAAQRRERQATVRLIGAGRRAVAALSALEMGVATLAGGLLGIALAIPLRNAAATLAINGTQSFVADLAPSTLWTLAAVAVVTVLGAGTAWWQAFRDDTGALGASRERAEKPVTAWRATTLVVGLVIFAGSAWLAMSVPEAANIASLTLIAGFALVAFGVVIAGPWLTRAAAQVFGRLTASASGVVAAGRLRRHPRSTFRSVAGLVVAVFLVSALAGVVSSITRLSTAEESEGMLSLDAVLAYTDADHAQAMEEAARATDGVQHVSVGYTPADMETIGVVMSREDAAAIGASDLPDADYVTVNLYAMLEATTFSADAEAPVPVAADGVDGLEPATVLAVTDGSQASIERARTSLDVAGDRSISPTTRRDFAAAGATDIMQELSVLAYVGMAIAVAISALSLAVATISAALERRRTFGLLRLAGMPVARLRAMVATEAAVPLGSTLLASAGLGFLVAWILVSVLGNGLEFVWPDGRYWATLLASAALAAAAVAGSFGVVRRSTEIESTRFE